MDLKEFIAQTLSQIASGVVEAQKETSKLGAVVSPVISASSNHASEHGFLHSHDGPAQVIQFDVALTAKEGTGTKGGIGIVAGVVSLGSTGQSDSENQSVNRIKFSIPMTLPKS